MITTAIYEAHASGQTWKSPGNFRSDARRKVESRTSQGGGRYIFFISRGSGRILDIQMVEGEQWDFPIPPESQRYIRTLSDRRYA